MTVRSAQRRAVHALIGNGTDRTYPEATATWPPSRLPLLGHPLHLT